MKISISQTSKELGIHAAEYSAKILNQCIQERGKARLLLSTGKSQFDTLEALVLQDIDWSRVEMFHLDEYTDISEEHPASFRKYLKERFLSKAPVGRAHLISGDGDLYEEIRGLTSAIREEPIDLALIGIGENAHIAFNDPPADFDTKEAYRIVALDRKCRQQQVGEGWFSSVDDVPKLAVSMTVHQIMLSRAIVSCVPFAVKADAIKKTMENEVTNQIPATILKTHPQFALFLDQDSASLLAKSSIAAADLLNPLL
jgi:glucosamine-6-phosphate deaminase